MKRLTVVGLLIAPAIFIEGAAGQSAPPTAATPANLCQELVAFVKQPEPANQAAATPPQQATAVSNPSGKTEGAPSNAAGDTQQKSGLSGSTDANGATKGAPSNPELAKANAAAKVPPAAAAPAPAPKPDAAMIAKVEELAAANDLAGCRSAARAMRVAGVAMPPALLALAALNPGLAAR